MELLTGTNVNFIGKRKIAITGSLIVILAGIVSLIVHGGPRYGIDFSGGTLLTLHFSKPIPADQIRDALEVVEVEGEKYDLSRSEIKRFGAPTDVAIRVEEMGTGTKVGDAIKASLKAKFTNYIPPKESDWVLKQEKVGPKIGKELKGKAVKAILLALLIMLVYISIRFEFKFAVGAIVALFHDVLITIGIFFLLNKEFSLAIIAALLTIVGYSLNDTIVVYDRIRENLRLMHRAGYGQTINSSINQTLSRTIITSFTTLLVIFTLYFLGGEVIRNFTFAMMIGVFVGTYSSIFIASPILVEWEARSARRRR
jgi:preprotein translocase SecF subunit